MSAALDAQFGAAFDALGACAVAVKGGAGDLFMEIMDPASRNVWMLCEPVTRDQYKAVAPPPPIIKSGYAPAAMDRAAFAHSCDTPGSFHTMQVGEMVFHQNARPGAIIPPQTPHGPMQITVNKHHLIGFDAGRSVAVMEHDGAHFVEVVGVREGDDTRVLPKGAHLRTLTLDEPWVVMLPAPPTTFFWMGKAMRSFQGPVDLPVAASTTDHA